MKIVGYKYLKEKFNYCQNVSWGDVINKIDNEFRNKSHKFLVEEGQAPTFVLHNSYLPGTLTQVFDRVNHEMRTKVLHVYTSLGGNSPTFGRHKDEMDVLIIQSIGQIKYKIDNDTTESDTVTLNPGDGLIIKEGVYHTPIIKEPRVTLSFSW
tara:strand:- start:1013 stop:1471 length:459 start_codon:yes stop_codon:yes gene_type:complete